MLEFLKNLVRHEPVNACFCTLAIHRPYRERARLLVTDVPAVSWIVFTDEPNDFVDLPVRAVHHAPTGPMARDFLSGKLPPTGNGHGRPAYHDKRFVLQAALEDFDTAIFVDADSRITSLPKLPAFRPGIAAVKALRTSIADHLTRYGTHRLPAFEQLALNLIGDINVLKTARWCDEWLFAVTKDGNESRFIEAWARGAEFLQERGLFSGEGGVIGLAAVHAGWKVDYKRMNKLAAVTKHEGHGPKSS